MATPLSTWPHKAWTIGGGFFLLGILAWLAHLAHASSPELPGAPTTYLVEFVGWAIGCLAGFLASPSDPRETERFSKVGTAIGFFISGYLLSKLEPSLRIIFENGVLVTNPLYGIRLAVFVAAFICGAVQMYVYRYYSRPHDNKSTAGADTAS
jgi:hypothetical protein